MPISPNSTEIAFYVGSTQSLQARLLLACKVAAKAYAQRLATYIYTDSEASSEQLDRLLWTFDEMSFIPHTLVPNQLEDQDVTVFISHELEQVASYLKPAESVLINLSNQIPEGFEPFARLAEVIDQETSILHAGRQRYQFYRDQGYNLAYHQLR